MPDSYAITHSYQELRSLAGLFHDARARGVELGALDLALLRALYLYRPEKDRAQKLPEWLPSEIAQDAATRGHMLVWPSLQELAWELGCDVKTVLRHIARLVRAKLLVVHRFPREEKRQSSLPNVYEFARVLEVRKRAHAVEDKPVFASEKPAPQPAADAGSAQTETTGPQSEAATDSAAKAPTDSPQEAPTDREPKVPQESPRQEGHVADPPSTHAQEEASASVPSAPAPPRRCSAPRHFLEPSRATEAPSHIELEKLRALLANSPVNSALHRYAKHCLELFGEGSARAEA